MEKGNLIFIGLPQSGKSTYIASLWHIVESKELDNSLTITSQPIQREYLNRLRTSWLSCTKLTRNVGDFKNDIELRVSTDLGQNVDLLFPDLAGEIYESHFLHRKMTNEFVEKLKSTSNIVLFVNPEYVVKPILISAADFLDDLVDEGEARFNKDAKEHEEVEAVDIDWEHKSAPTQVVLVDLLQMMLEYIQNPKVVIIISAWDLVLNLPNGDANKRLPKDWLTAELPLLSQFLHSNSDLLQFNVFGVSAQGGDYENDTDKAKLQEKHLPSARIIVEQENGDKSNDISLPVKWVLDAE